MTTLPRLCGRRHNAAPRRPRSSGKRAPMYGRTAPSANICSSSALSRIGLVGIVGREGADLHAAHRDSLEQHQIQRDRRDAARRVAQRDERAAAAQPAQRRLGVLAADRVEHHRGAGAPVISRMPVAQILLVVVDDGLRTALPADLELLGRLDAAAITLALIATARSTAARPTPPAAPSTTTQSSGLHRRRPCASV